MDMLNRLGNIKLNLSGVEVVLIIKGGLIKDAIHNDTLKLDILFGWNLYSSFRYLFEEFQVNYIYRRKDGKWKKLNIEKVKNLAYEPMIKYTGEE